MGDVKKETVEQIIAGLEAEAAALSAEGERRGADDAEMLDSVAMMMIKASVTLKSLNRAALRQPDTRMEGGGWPAKWQVEAAWARAEKMSSDTRIQNMSALREILKAVEEARSKLAPNEYPEDIERAAPSSPTVGELEVSKAIDFMNEMARYFENRPTGGEDMAFWANVTNKRNCEGVATLLSSAQSSIQRAERERDEAREHIEQLSELLKIIKEHWIDYDHVFSIAVHEADQFLASLGEKQDAE